MDEVEGQYMGLLGFQPSGWAKVRGYLDSIPSGAVDKLDVTSLLRKLIEHGVKIRAVPCEGSWGEVDSASDLALYNALVGRGEIGIAS